MTLRTDYTNDTPLDDEHPDAHNDTNTLINALDARIAALETAGTTILNGAGAPASTLGVDGDYYLDTSNHTLYGPATVTGTPSGPTLAWSDEFNGTTLNTSIWENVGTYFNYGDSGGQKLANVSLMAQCEVSGGTLKMHAVETAYPTDGRTPNPAPWRAAGIQAKFNSGYRFKYGQRMEYRIHVPVVSGIRPSVWVTNRGGYPGYIADDADGEFDLVEQYFNAYEGGERNQSALVWDYSPVKQHNDHEYGAGVASGWHTYAAEWDDTIRVYRDGVLKKEYTTWASAKVPPGGPPTFPRPFHDGAEYWVLLTFQIGGIWSAHSWNRTTGSQYIQPVDPAVHAVDWTIDYIRVYDMDTGGGGTPTTSWPIAAVGIPPGGTAGGWVGQPTIDITNTAPIPGRSGECGVRVRFEQTGQVTGVRYLGKSVTTSVNLRVWPGVGGSRLILVAGQSNSAGEHTVLFPAPLAVNATEEYVFSYSGSGSDAPYRAEAATVTSSAAVTFIGMYRSVTTDQFPGTVQASETYFLEPIFETAAPGQTLKKTAGTDYAVGWS